MPLQRVNFAIFIIQCKFEQNQIAFFKNCSPPPTIFIKRPLVRMIITRDLLTLVKPTNRDDAIKELSVALSEMQLDQLDECKCDEVVPPLTCFTL